MFINNTCAWKLTKAAIRSRRSKSPMAKYSAARMNCHLDMQCRHLFQPDHKSLCLTVRLVFRLERNSKVAPHWRQDCALVYLYVLAAGEVELGAGPDARGPPHGHGFQPGVKPHALHAVDMVIAEQRTFPTAE